MADLSNDYGVDPLTGERVAVDPPLQASETPLMGNPILTRRTAPARARSNTALYASSAVALIAILAGGVYLLASGTHSRNDLMTTADAASARARDASRAKADDRN